MIRIIKEYNVETGEEIIYEREETPEEKLARENFEKEMAEKIAKQAEIDAAKSVILEKLGLTPEEANLLLS